MSIGKSEETGDKKEKKKKDQKRMGERVKENREDTMQREREGKRRKEWR